MGREPIVLVSIISITCLAAGACAAQPADFRLGPPPGRFFPIERGEARPARVFPDDAPIVGTYFFYWYDDVSGAHFVDGDGTDALTDHPPRREGYSYLRPAWWEREMREVRAAGIDFILPVFWGVPGHPEEWSFRGLPPLVEAWERLEAAGRKPPMVGLFYDTSTLRYNAARVRIDLGTSGGQDWFYGTIRDFFSMIPPRMWIIRRGGPIVLLYGAGFHTGEWPGMFDAIRKRFARDFGCLPFLVKEVSWPGEADATYAWGGALGLKLFSVAALGPGYDHSAVPGRTPLVVPREDGAFYRRNWERLLTYRPPRRPSIVMVETWNELHEGTEIAETKEYGRAYIEMTAKYAALFREGAVLPRGGPYAKAESVAVRAGERIDEAGIRVPNRGDGLWEAAAVAGRRAILSKPNPHHGNEFLYLDIDESFLFDEEDASIEVEADLWADEAGAITVEFDGADPKASVREGAFQAAKPIAVAARGAWFRAKVSIRGARLANRSNDADLRFGAAQGHIAIASVVIRKGPSAPAAP
ncbi:MAG: DUF5010 domain-containing protein [Planctomycetes bacterium]|nr:DUF5010 domain-containing protein [Planctomycetota bacterium]